MIKKTLCILLCLTLMLFLIGCGRTIERVPEKHELTSMFIIIEGDGLSGYWVVYQRDTKVMYVVSNGTYNAGNFTLLVNPDGTPMIWNEKEN